MVFTCYSLSDMRDAAHVKTTFRYRHKLLVDRLLSQGYKVNQMGNFPQKFYGRYPELVAKYQKSVRDVLNDSFPF